MTPRELIAAATEAVQREDFTEAHRCYSAAWHLIEADRIARETRTADRAQARKTVVETGFLLAGVALSLSLLWW